MIHGCRTRSDFERLSRDGQRSSGRLIWVRAVIDDAVETPRVAFAIGRRHGNAVTRNRLRRRLRAALNSEQVTVPKGLFLLGWKVTPEREPRFADLVLDLERLMRRVEA